MHQEIAATKLAATTRTSCASGARETKNATNGKYNEAKRYAIIQAHNRQYNESKLNESIAQRIAQARCNESTIQRMDNTTTPKRQGVTNTKNSKYYGELNRIESNPNNQYQPNQTTIPKTTRSNIKAKLYIR
jgi:predicted nucleotidyltransferase